MSFETVISKVKAHQATLVAVSKTKPLDAILELYRQGHLDFGENRVQELVKKYKSLPKDINWHQIGRLQSNKVKSIAPFVHLIHSVDSKKLILAIAKEAMKNERCIDILLQVKVAQEETKQGINLDEVDILLTEIKLIDSKWIRLRGLMAMGTFTYDMEQVKAEFLAAKDMFDSIKSKYFLNFENFDILSMGMSGDYELALDCGSTMVRVGSLIFGERD